MYGRSKANKSEELSATKLHSEVPWIPVLPVFDFLCTRTLQQISLVQQNRQTAYWDRSLYESAVQLYVYELVCARMDILWNLCGWSRLARHSSRCHSCLPLFPYSTSMDIMSNKRLDDKFVGLKTWFSETEKCLRLTLPSKKLLPKLSITFKWPFCYQKNL